MRRAPPFLLAASLLLWPALINGYPLVFADSGTYLSQAVNHYLGWDRPIFYSLFLLPLHLTVTTWPIIVVQALLTAWVIELTGRVLIPCWATWMILPTMAALALLTPLPWAVSEISPDLFTALMILCLALLVLARQRMAAWERWAVTGLAAFAVSAHLSNLPIAAALLIVLLPRRPSWKPLLAPALGVVGLIAVNLAAGRGFAVAPYGNVFLLARVMEDGPGRDALSTHCLHSTWQLCRFAGRIPTTADAFLWNRDSPLYLAGGPKQISIEANSIIAAAVRDEPGKQVSAFARNAVRQAARFATGDGLHPWPREVTPWIVRDFPPSELARYTAARQTNGIPLVPDWLQHLHFAVSFAAIGASLLLYVADARQPRASPPVRGRGQPKSPLPSREGFRGGGQLSQSRRGLCGEPENSLNTGFLQAVLAGLLINAMVCGGLSGPHDRYQSRVMWLPGLVAGLVLASRARK